MSTSSQSSAPTRLKVAIVGAGWYGCHLACKLLELGQEVVVFEKASDIFLGSSGYNQFRLHQGFHYPRSGITRRQVMNSYNKFRESYPSLFAPIHKNIYVIASDSSLIDFMTFREVMEASGCEFNVGDLAHCPQFRNIEGFLECQEGALLADEPRTFFKDKLKDVLQLNREVKEIHQIPDGSGVVVDGEWFSWCLDCTYCCFRKPSSLPIFYEPCISLVVRKVQEVDKIEAFTVMDGEFVSVYPYFKDTQSVTSGTNDLYTLTHVKYTPLGQFKTIEEAVACIKSVTPEVIEQRKKLFFDGITHFMPHFQERFAFHDHFLSMKTKLLSNSASRECVVLQEGRMVHVMSGKVNTIFEAEERVFSILNIH